MPNPVRVCSVLPAFAVCGSHTGTKMEMREENHIDVHVDYVFFSYIVGSEKYSKMSGLVI